MLGLGRNGRNGYGLTTFNTINVRQTCRYMYQSHGSVMGYGMVIILGDHLLPVDYDAFQTCITVLILHIPLGHNLHCKLG